MFVHQSASFYGGFTLIRTDCLAVFLPLIHLGALVVYTNNLLCGLTLTTPIKKSSLNMDCR